MLRRRAQGGTYTPPPGPTWSVTALDETGTSYALDQTALDEAGTTYTLDPTALDETGATYTLA